MPRSEPIEKDAEFVFDASVAVRALVARREAAVAWMRRVEWGEISATWPELAYIEMANGFRTLVLTKTWSTAQANEAMERGMELPLHSIPLTGLTKAALELALDRGLTPYDACYVVLAELTHATLITADKRMAAVTSRSVLV